MIPHKQISLADIYSDCKTFFESDKPKFLSLLKNTINLDEFIPNSFYQHFYASTGRPRKYNLHSMMWPLIIQCIFSIPTDTLLITFLHYSSELRDLCGFDKVPDGSTIYQNLFVKHLIFYSSTFRNSFASYTGT